MRLIRVIAFLCFLAYSCTKAEPRIDNPRFDTLPPRSPIVVLPTISLLSVTNVLDTASTFTGRIFSDGGAPVQSFGICWKTSSGPTINDNKDSGLFIGKDTFSVTMRGIQPNTQYFVKAYAVNSAGIAYSEEMTFTSAAASNGVTTIEITDTLMNQVYYANTNFGKPTRLVFTRLKKVTDFVHFSKTTNLVAVEFPALTTTDNHFYFYENADLTKISAPALTEVTRYVFVYGNKKLNQLDICNLWEVNCKTSQSYIEIAHNLVNTTLSGCMSVHHMNVGPTVKLLAPTNITSQSVTLSGKVVTGCTRTGQYNVCLSTSSNPLYTTNPKTCTNQNGLISGTLTGLNPNTRYYIRLFNSEGREVFYSNEQSFVTLP